MSAAHVSHRWLARAYLIVLFVAVLTFSSMSVYPFSSSSPFASVEVQFSDISKSGLSIVPASCPSAPPPASPDGGGYTLGSGTSGAWIARHGYDFCVSNGSGSTYFVPANTGGELGAFYNSPPPGVGIQSPAAFH